MRHGTFEQWLWIDPGEPELFGSPEAYFQARWRAEFGRFCRTHGFGPVVKATVTAHAYDAKVGAFMMALLVTFAEGAFDPAHIATAVNAETVPQLLNTRVPNQAGVAA